MHMDGDTQYKCLFECFLFLLLALLGPTPFALLLGRCCGCGRLCDIFLNANECVLCKINKCMQIRNRSVL